MNFKRRKTRRNVRCTLCTDVRWMGNAKGRAKAMRSNHRDRQKVRAEIQMDAER
jgi:hypothetical protein